MRWRHDLGLGTEHLVFCGLDKFSKALIDRLKLCGREFTPFSRGTANSLIDSTIDGRF
jgi:hypothetical protein